MFKKGLIILLPSSCEACSKKQVDTAFSLSLLANTSPLINSQNCIILPADAVDRLHML
jgi:hypothetical protein